MPFVVQGDVEKAEELKGWIDESRERLDSQRRQRMLASTFVFFSPESTSRESA